MTLAYWTHHNPGHFCTIRGVTVNFWRTIWKLVYTFSMAQIWLKKKFEALALQPFEKIDFKVFKKIIYKWKKFFFLVLIAPSDRKSCEDHESPHFYGSTTLSFWVIAILKSIFLDFIFFQKFFGFQFSNFWANFFFSNACFWTRIAMK